MAEPNSICHHHSARAKIPTPLITKAIAAKTNRVLAMKRMVESPRKLEKIHDLPVQVISGLNSTSLWLNVKNHK